MTQSTNIDFQSLSIDSEYRSFRQDIVKKFFIPVLSRSISYNRAVGFFSSTSLIEVSNGLSGLVKNQGKVQLICSPYLTEEDFEVIRSGYSQRKKIIEKLLYNLYEPSNEFGQERLNLLANLIKENVLDIKIAFMKNLKTNGLYHEKMGILKDDHNNVVAFSGSLNESYTAYRMNYESIDVFCSWKSEDNLERIRRKEEAFNSIWNNHEPNMETLDIPEVTDAIIDKYLKNRPNYSIDLEEYGTSDNDHDLRPEKGEGSIQLPDGVILYTYQEEAIDEWESNNFRGIFDMATGTGKTLTALGGIIRLFRKVDGEIAIIIVCPFQHLVEQWVEDIEACGIKPIIGYSQSSQKNWKADLANSIRDQKLGIPNKEFFCFVTTNATFASSFVQRQLNRIVGNALIVADEAHNFGAQLLKTKLPENFLYRLALSATLERHNDDEGTQFLFQYFGEKCIEYTLEQAISEKKLTEYYYHPILVTLTSDEIASYLEISARIAKCFITDKNGHKTLNELGKKLAIKRSRLIAGASNKLNAIREEIEPFKEQSHILVYCGATSVLEPDQDTTPIEQDDLRQIGLVTNILGNELNMKVSQFTSRENIKERAILKEEFQKGGMLQALIAIKCLDEGVNIPAIKTAFILASTTNPKEYIQRRGRVLRLAEGKQFSRIFDFITIPYGLDEVVSLTENEISPFETLIKNELSRGHEFARIALNSFSAEKVLTALEDAYINTPYISASGGANEK